MEAALSPEFSVVIPTRNRRRQLVGCLEALDRLDYPRDRFEVVVVDDGGEQPLADVVAAAEVDARLVRQPHAGCATARNTGALEARGNFLAFTDDDCAPSPSWLSQLARRFEETPDHMVGGRTINGLPHNPYATASQTLITFLYTYYNDPPDEARFFASNNIAMAKANFESVGGFDPSVPRPAAEDRELCDRWLHHGFSMVYAPEVVVWHRHDLTLRRFWRQHFGYGRGAYFFHRARARRGNGRIEIEPPAFYVDLIRYPFAALPSGAALQVAPLMAMSQIANAAGFFWERFQAAIPADGVSEDTGVTPS